MLNFDFLDKTQNVVVTTQMLKARAPLWPSLSHDPTTEQAWTPTSAKSIAVTDAIKRSGNIFSSTFCV